MKSLKVAGISALLVLCVAMALAQDAAHDVDKGATKTGHFVKHAGKKVGHATESGVKDAGHGTKVVGKESAKGVKKASEKTGEGIKDAAGKKAPSKSSWILAGSARCPELHPELRYKKPGSCVL
jgi:hypothetical protein